ncbi:hypothetical protein RHSP_19669 [Rhizobium freirei PRF 81]|uniref:Uncharacterized protein n=1 Tax=Rhizobium freirei PRF 81 TaxID=363754 RepID=N6U151_9HYPH|nr:hypothetical protein RHSP_19669 [Rhizobium freirei PRF 81]
MKRLSDWIMPSSGRGLAPALGRAFLGVDRLQARNRLVRHQRNAGIEEGLAFGRLRLFARRGELLDRLDAEGSHHQRILLRRRADHAFLDGLDARAAAVNRHDQNLLFQADGLQSLIGADGGRFVDRVDDVDARILLQEVFHGLAAALLVAVGNVMADDARIGFVADLVRILRVDAEADHEALVAQDVNGRLRWRQIQEADLGVLHLVTQRFLCPLTNQLASEKIVCGKGRVGGVGRLQRRVERDDQQARVACLLDRGNDALGVGGGDQNTLGTAGDAALDRGNLAFAVTVDLAGIGLQRHAEFLGLGRRTFLHLDEEGVGIGLGDEAGGHVCSLCRRGKGNAERQSGDRCRNNRFLHSILPMFEKPDRPAFPDERPGWRCAMPVRLFWKDLLQGHIRILDAYI